MPGLPPHPLQTHKCHSQLEGQRVQTKHCVLSYPENTLDAERLWNGSAPERQRTPPSAKDPFVLRTGAAPPDTESLEDARDLVRIHA